MRANTQYQERPGLPRADDGVRQALHAGGIEEHRPKVGDLSAHRVAVAHQVIAGRGLLPGVRHDNPDRAEMSAERDHKGRQEMGLWLYLVPAEQEHGQKTGFEEESEDALRRQRAAEDVADVAGVSGPIGAKLELHHNAGRHADGERQRENLHPELRHLEVKRVARLEPERFDEDDDDAQTNAQRRIDIMKCDGERKLQSGQKFDLHAIIVVFIRIPTSRLRKLEDSLAGSLAERIASTWKWRSVSLGR